LAPRIAYLHIQIGDDQNAKDDSPKFHGVGFPSIIGSSEYFVGKDINPAFAQPSVIPAKAHCCPG
jgi:hypothetical protein